jgi:hypothetical protein
MPYDLNARADLAPLNQADGWATKNLHKKPDFFIGCGFFPGVEGTRQALVDSPHYAPLALPAKLNLSQIGAF